MQLPTSLPMGTKLAVRHIHMWKSCKYVMVDETWPYQYWFAQFRYDWEYLTESIEAGDTKQTVRIGKAMIVPENSNTLYIQSDSNDVNDCSKLEAFSMTIGFWLAVHDYVGGSGFLHMVDNFPNCFRASANGNSPPSGDVGSLALIGISFLSIRDQWFLICGIWSTYSEFGGLGPNE